VKQHVTVIVPPVVCHNLDPHTGIPFMPHIAAYMAGTLRDAGYQIQVIDAFGLQPNQRQVVRDFMLMGVDEEWIVAHLHPETAMVYIYCRTIAEFIAVERLIEALRNLRPDIKIGLFENIQAVTSYSLRPIAAEWLGKGCDVVLMGEPEDRVVEVTRAFLDDDPIDHILGIAYRARDGASVVKEETPLNETLDRLAMPAWEHFPLEGYWRAGFAHAPVKAGSRFLPLLTSRGCPYRCTFCIAPSVNPKWRARSAAVVVNEIEHFNKTMGVTDFHVSDLNPTVSEPRICAICEEILKRDLRITWKLAQGTKIETIKHESTLELMAKAGCRFISFSPESGSSRLLAIMNKPFDHEHGVRMLKKMAEVNIRTQAVFLGGVPGENSDDQGQSLAYAKRLIKLGLDEVSLVIFTPLPGAALAGAIKGFEHYSQCTPSPSWRLDYDEIRRYRFRMYGTYFLAKIMFQPRKFMRSMYGLMTGQYETKMEMSLFKQLKLYGLRYLPGLFPQLDAEAVQQAADRGNSGGTLGP
jgi:radical SAM superfamily enzyme YgiQ (UPF0313 family)